MSDPDQGSQEPYRTPTPVSDERPVKTKSGLSKTMWFVLLGVGMVTGGGAAYALFKPVSNFNENRRPVEEISTAVEDFGASRLPPPEEEAPKK